MLLTEKENTGIGAGAGAKNADLYSACKVCSGHGTSKSRCEAGSTGEASGVTRRGGARLEPQVEMGLEPRGVHAQEGRGSVGNVCREGVEHKARGRGAPTSQEPSEGWGPVRTDSEEHLRVSTRSVLQKKHAPVMCSISPDPWSLMCAQKKDQSPALAWGLTVFVFPCFCVLSLKISPVNTQVL